ncbi:efflux RND transporter periplasmic adaptor subunit [Lichenifustis flavocetrariae]|uniref:Efflux RND transporter periplasmic adaptor subunit n=1 Tax=Lichenifustis flavocetrariae TaxID=2949735 RepID=A0AA41Z386_9HYPH|nr:efflux RND transporter periplasmic adaptor subunit [Lichenifustis flavocetrariae]MCW6512202.1 efflux RND transporter periplasmic adaptor subunit [Lichenifustis flavocetrariae]
MNEHVPTPDTDVANARQDQRPNPGSSPEKPAKLSSGDGDRPDPQQERGRFRIAVSLGVAMVILVAGLVAWGVRGHALTDATAQEALGQLHDAVPQVRIAAVKMLPGSRRIDLPGDMQPFNAATIYARATGYIKTRSVDIGSKVRQGDVLAVIAAPDLDKQLAQAQAQLDQASNSHTQAMANRKLAGATEGRTADLVEKGWATRQQGDTDSANLASNNANVDVAKATIKADKANVGQLTELVGYEQVMAPFDGVITVRDIDVGNLVVANNQTGTQMFSIASTDVLRVQIYVPQEDYFGVKDGQDATVTVPELPGREFHGKVTRNASALQSGTRTLLVEVDLDNHDGALTAGLFGIVHLDVPRTTPVALVPSEAVIFDKDGLSAAVFDNGVLRLRHLDVLVDNGAELEAKAGLKEGDELILNPPRLATDGMRVTTVPAK